jgi:hypothetical protein
MQEWPAFDEEGKRIETKEPSIKPRANDGYL